MTVNESTATPEPTHTPRTMQAEHLPTSAECRALRGELNASNEEISQRTRTTRVWTKPGPRKPYRVDRISSVLNDKQPSQPLLNAVYAALLEIRDERRAAAGDRAAMDRLDAREGQGTLTLT